jgi:hypothetical protein
MATISKAITKTVTLSNSGSYASPLTITAAGSVKKTSGIAIYGGPNATQTWTVDNYGTVSGGGSSGVGVEFGGNSDGGSVTNGSSTDTTALIAGGVEGVQILGSAGSTGTVTNYGTISETSTAFSTAGIELYQGGTVTNKGTVTGAHYAINFWPGTSAVSTPSTLSNSGVIQSTGSIGVLMNAGGSVNNSGTISATGSGAYGIRLLGISTITNSGTITGGTGAIDFNNGGSLTNTKNISASVGVTMFADGYVNNSGTIAGTSGVGVYFSGGGDYNNTLINSGTISGSGTNASVKFNDTGTNRVVVDPGAQFTGKVTGSTSATNTLELASGTSGTLTAKNGTVTGVGGTTFTSFGILDIDGGADWKISGSNTIASTGALNNNGTLEIASGATVKGKVTFSGASAFVKIDGTQSGVVLSTTTFANMVSGDTIDLAGVGYNATHSANYASGTLTIVENSHTYSLKLSGIGAGEFFHLASDGASGTDITENNVACYRRGTLILTPTGEMPVEDLAIGDYVMTLSGRARPIEWIGRRSYGGRFLAGNRNVLPIVIKQGALADDIPARDLWVSPEHALYLDGALVPAQCLVNGSSIFQAESIEQVEYFHIELDSHDVIFAEGAAAESFVDDNSRLMFHNATEFFSLYPEKARRAPAVYCAPRMEDGLALEALRRRLHGRAQLLGERSRIVPVMLQGQIDMVTQERITGWAFDPASPDTPVTVVVLGNGVELGRVVADHRRRDLTAAEIGNGCHGFALVMPDGVYPEALHEIAAYGAAGWCPLAGSPATLALGDAAERTEVSGPTVTRQRAA